jgi:uncharacterized protein (TIGR03435 family)
MRMRTISKALMLGRALVLATLASVVIAIPIVSQTLTGVPKWEAVSIKPCKAAPGTRGGGPPILSPGRMTLNCQSLSNLVRMAYVQYADGQSHPPLSGLGLIPVEGPPGIGQQSSDAYTINAKAEGAPSNAMMGGPMLQSILEDRFKLKIHHEMREIPVYVLTVARGGHKLQPFKEGSCVLVDRSMGIPIERPLAPGEKRCLITAGPRGQPIDGWLDITIDVQGLSVEEFIKMFFNGPPLDRPVINKTGIMGLFDFHLEFAAPSRLDTGPLTVSEPTTGPKIFSAIQDQLGLKLEPTKGPSEFLVIDSVERPTEN